MQRKIMWHKWQDPLAPVVRGRQTNEDDDHAYHMAMSTFDQDYSGYQVGQQKGDVGPAIVGPLGIIPLHESNLPSRLFTFWIGHTNFDITHDVRDAINYMDGVEAVDVFSRYRFRVAVGKAFNAEVVKKNIEDALCNDEEPEDIVEPQPIDSVKRLASSRFPYWAVVFLPEGKVEVVGGQSQDEVTVKLGKLANVENTVVSWSK